MGAVADGGGVPGDRVGGAAVLRAEVLVAVELELDAGHADVVGGVGGHGDVAGDRRAGRGGRDGDRWGRGVVLFRRGGALAGGGGVSRGVAGPRGQGVGAVAVGRVVPGDLVGGAVC